MKKALETLLDSVAVLAGMSMDERVREVIDRFLLEREEKRELDWRYYMVKYAEMRKGESGIYVSGGRAMGFNLCMLKTTRMHGYYRDPYLTAVYEHSGRSQQVVNPRPRGGYATDERWLDVKGGGIGLRCVDDGFVVRPPVDVALVPSFESVRKKHGVGEDGRLCVEQIVRGDERFDATDRISVAVAFVKSVLAAHPGVSPA